MALRRSTAPATAPATPQTSLLPLEEEEGSGYCDKRSFFGARMSGRGLAVAAILVTVQLIFGGYAIVVKLALNDSVDALVFSLYRDLGASVVLGGACLLMGERKPVPPSDRLLFLGVGFFGITITQTAMVVALQYVPAFNASLMQPSQPVLTLLLALLLRMETLRLRSAAGSLKVLGILIGCAGATYTVLSAAHTKDETSEPAHPAGVSGILFGNALLVLQVARGALPAPLVPRPLLPVRPSPCAPPGRTRIPDALPVSVRQCVGGAIFQLLNKQLTGRYPSITVAACIPSGGPEPPTSSRPVRIICRPRIRPPHRGRRLLHRHRDAPRDRGADACLHARGVGAAGRRLRRALLRRHPRLRLQLLRLRVGGAPLERVDRHGLLPAASRLRRDPAGGRRRAPWPRR